MYNDKWDIPEYHPNNYIVIEDVCYNKHQLEGELREGRIGQVCISPRMDDVERSEMLSLTYDEIMYLPEGIPYRPNLS